MWYSYCLARTYHKDVGQEESESLVAENDGGHDVDEDVEEEGRHADHEEEVVQERDRVRVNVQLGDLVINLRAKE